MTPDRWARAPWHARQAYLNHLDRLIRERRIAKAEITLHRAAIEHERYKAMREPGKPTPSASQIEDLRRVIHVLAQALNDRHRKARS